MESIRPQLTNCDSALPKEYCPKFAQQKVCSFLRGCSPNVIDASTRVFMADDVIEWMKQSRPEFYGDYLMLCAQSSAHRNQILPVAPYGRCAYHCSDSLLAKILRRLFGITCLNMQRRLAAPFRCPSNLFRHKQIIKFFSNIGLSSLKRDLILKTKYRQPLMMSLPFHIYRNVISSDPMLPRFKLLLCRSIRSPLFEGNIKVDTHGKPVDTSPTLIFKVCAASCAVSRASDDGWH